MKLKWWWFRWLLLVGLLATGAVFAAAGVPANTRLVARAYGDRLEVWRAGEWRPLLVVGVNLGLALPGHTFGQPPQEVAVYRGWFRQMRGLGINTVRVYSLLPPAFYQALREHNLAEPEPPLWLLQEVWPEENPAGNDYLAPANLRPFLDEIALEVDALHGAVTIPHRSGRAWGVYTADVYPWLLGWLIGRELEPDEVATTNACHPNFRYAGRFMT
ncbi:MAG: hypothetical protein WCH61_00100, partial [bacterium]